MKKLKMKEAVKQAKRRYYRSRGHLMFDKIKGHHAYRKAMLWGLEPMMYTKFTRKARYDMQKVRRDERSLRISIIQLSKLRTIHSKHVYFVDDTHLFGDQVKQTMQSLNY